VVKKAFTAGGDVLLALLSQKAEAASAIPKRRAGNDEGLDVTASSAPNGIAWPLRSEIDIDMSVAYVWAYDRTNYHPPPG
jgi:hypothetical protein